VDPDALLHPVGPEPARVYWIRRAVVVGLPLLLLIVLLANLGGGGGSRSPGQAAGPSAGPSARASTIPAPTTAMRATATPSPAATSPSGCPSLTVAAAADAASYASGTLPQLTIAVTNTGSSPCTRDLGPAARSLIVYRGADRVWSSADCASAAPVPQVLAPGRTVRFTTTWNRQRSSPGCPSAAAAADPGPGGYILRGQLAGLPPADGGSFTLS